MTLALLAVGGLAAYLAGVLRLRRSGRGWSVGRVSAAVVAAVLVAVAGLLPADLWGAVADGTATSGAGQAAPGGEAALGSAGHGTHGSAHPVAHGPAHSAVAHMLQHVLLGMVVPVAVVAASPLRLLLALSPTRSRRPLARVLRSRAVHVLSHPVVAAVPVLVGLHVLLLTPLYALSLQVAWVHGLVLAHTLLSGTWSALTLVGGDPAPARSSLAVRLGTLAVLAGAHAHLATLLYARAPALPPGAPSSAEELRDAALVMYYAGDAAELLLAAAVVLAWYRAGAGRARRAVRPVGAGLAPATG